MYKVIITKVYPGFQREFWEAKIFENLILEKQPQKTGSNAVVVVETYKTR